MMASNLIVPCVTTREISIESSDTVCQLQVVLNHRSWRV